MNVSIKKFEFFKIVVVVFVVRVQNVKQVVYIQDNRIAEPKYFYSRLVSFYDWNGIYVGEIFSIRESIDLPNNIIMMC